MVVTEPLQKHILDRIGIQAQLQAAVVQVDAKANEFTLAWCHRRLVKVVFNFSHLELGFEDLNSGGIFLSLSNEVLHSKDILHFSVELTARPLSTILDDIAVWGTKWASID